MTQVTDGASSTPPGNNGHTLAPWSSMPEDFKSPYQVGGQNSAAQSQLMATQQIQVSGLTDQKVLQVEQSLSALQSGSSRQLPVFMVECETPCGFTWLDNGKNVAEFVATHLTRVPLGDKSKTTIITGYINTGDNGALNCAQINFGGNSPGQVDKAILDFRLTDQSAAVGRTQIPAGGNRV